MQPHRKQLNDGRWHFHYGPIDLVISVDGDSAAIDASLAACWHRFGEILPELVAELRTLRQPLSSSIGVQSPVALRMMRACWPHRAQFITPMAAVAGAVADELISFFAHEPEITRASINNGGDIALHLQPGYHYDVGLVTTVASWRKEAFSQAAIDTCGSFRLLAEMPVRGVATSGWRGRSQSLGIADSVTVLAATAAAADATATMIANAVNVTHDAILRVPARQIKDDSDLGDRLVTTSVGSLPPSLVNQALQSGAREAQRCLDEEIIFAAVLCLQGQVATAGLVSHPLSLQWRDAA